MIYEIIPIMANQPLWEEPFTEWEIIDIVTDWYLRNVGIKTTFDEDQVELPIGLLYLDEEPWDVDDEKGIILATLNPIGV